MDSSVVNRTPEVHEVAGDTVEEDGLDGSVALAVQDLDGDRGDTVLPVEVGLAGDSAVAAVKVDWMEDRPQCCWHPEGDNGGDYDLSEEMADHGILAEGDKGVVTDWLHFQCPVEVA